MPGQLASGAQGMLSYLGSGGFNLHATLASGFCGAVGMAASGPSPPEAATETAPPLARTGEGVWQHYAKEDVGARTTKTAGYPFDGH